MRACWLWRHAGYRGMFLLLLAAFDVFYGLYLVLGAPLQFAPLIPERAWGIIWLAVAAALAEGALLGERRWHFALAVALKTAWAMEFFRLQHLHGSLEWTRGGYFLALAGLVLLASAWPEPR